MNVKDNRSFWVYLLLTFRTCGLYSIYFWYVYVEDLNTVFYGDGEDSPNYRHYRAASVLGYLRNLRCLLALQTGEPYVPRSIRPLWGDD